MRRSLIRDGERLDILPIVSKQSEEACLANLQEILNLTSCHMSLIILVQQRPDLLRCEPLVHLFHRILLVVVGRTIP